MGKGFWIALIAVLVVMVGGFLLLNDNDGPAANLENPHEIDAEIDHTIGSADAPVTLVKYSDFQCPACQASAELLPQVRAEFSEDELQFVYRHSPFLAQAFDAARASEAAAEQGAFWEMHDLIFERLQDWSGSTNARSLFENYAEELGLDAEQFQNDFTAVSDRVERDVEIRNQLEVTGTPTYFINGERIPQNPGTVEQFVEIIEDQLARAEEEDEAESNATESPGEDAIIEDEEEGSEE